MTRATPNRDFAREYGLDWLRVFAFFALIFYHTGMFFVRIMLITFTGSWLVFELVRRVGFLRPAFGLREARPS